MSAALPATSSRSIGSGSTALSRRGAGGVTGAVVDGALDAAAGVALAGALRTGVPLAGPAPAGPVGGPGGAARGARRTGVPLAGPAPCGRFGGAVVPDGGALGAFFAGTVVGSGTASRVASS